MAQTSQYQRRVLLFQPLFCRRHSTNDEFSCFSRYSVDVTVSTMSSLDSTVTLQTSQYQRRVLLIQPLFRRRHSTNDEFSCFSRYSVDVTVSTTGSFVQPLLFGDSTKRLPKRHSINDGFSCFSRCSVVTALDFYRYRRA